MKAVSLFMDVEDPINPLADDAALDLALLFTGADVRGSFCLTGEKCRTLLARGRTDVIEAYRPHALGLHTDTHSFHPTTMELLADLPWDQGCEAAYAAEQRGLDAFQMAFNRTPSFWGGAGNTWSPEITDALKRLGIPAYSYALTELPDNAVHRFNEVVALPQALSISEADWADDSRAAAASERVLRRLGEIDQPWIGIFVGHPTKLRYSEFWDKPYAHGRTPPEPEFVDPLPDDVYERSKANLAAFLSEIQGVADVIGVNEALIRSWEFRSPTPSELDYFNEHTPINLRSAKGWPIHRPDLDMAGIVEKTLALCESLETSGQTGGIRDGLLQ
jgi:hypothetical protein